MDIDFDGVPDLLVVHGGDPLKEPGIYNKFIKECFYNGWFLKSFELLCKFLLSLKYWNNLHG